MDTSQLKQLYKSERERLDVLCDKWQKILDSTKNRTSRNDTTGEILSVLGQTRLLLNKKLRQFEQLLADCEQGVGDTPPITLTDLEGFWELVMIQVKDVHTKFAALDQLNVQLNEPARSQKGAVPHSKSKLDRKFQPLPKYR